MAKARRVRRCFHCGAILQTTDRSKEGFISEKIIKDNKPDALLYCNRCYNKVKQINYSQLESDVDNEICKILKDAVATDALVIWVVDLFTFNGSLNEEVVKKVKSLKVCVVGTKRDLFPHNIKDKQFVKFLNDTFNEAGIKPYSIRIFGNEANLDGKALIEAINTARQGHDVYMIGSLTSGKTSIINRVLKSYENKSKWAIRTELYSGTEINVLTIPLSNSSSFYELPGFALNTSALSKLDNETKKFIIPKKSIKISQKTLSKGECLIIGNLVCYELIKGKSTTFKLFSAEGVELKKANGEDKNKILAENIKKKYLRPVSENYSGFDDYDVFEYDMENDNLSHDIYVTGLCWISFIAKGQTIRIFLPKGVAVKEHISKVS